MKDSTSLKSPPEEHATDSPIDTSQMGAGKREALEVTEAARDQSSAGSGFASQLFMGDFRPELMDPFPAQSEEDKRIGDALIQKLEPFLIENLDPEEVDATREIPQAVIDEMVRLGVFAMKIPKKYDGLGFSQVNYNRVMMMLASYCGSTAVLVSAHQSIGAPQPLKLFGTEAQKQKYLPRFRTGALSAFALTEPEVGSDPAQMSTFAEPTRDGEHFILNGEKLWCTNGTIADVIIVMARTPSIVRNGKERKQITAFIVETDWPGIEVVHRCDFMGIRGIQNGLLRFTNVKVPRENLLWEEGKGLKLALTTLNTGRLTLPAACAGMGKQCLSMARRWGAHRSQWGAAIGLHEAGSSKLALIAANTFAMEAVTLLTSHWADEGDRDIRIEAAMAKLFCSEMAWTVVDETLQMRGGRGYEKASSLKARGEPGFGVERMMRDCRINRIIEGTSEVMRLFLAREAIDPHLNLAGELLKRGVPLSRKLKAGLSMAIFYGIWYPKQWLNSSFFRSRSDEGPLGSHFKYIDSTSRRLARTLFHKMAVHKDKLDRRQNTLGRLMDIGVELFAMTATCRYAQRLSADSNEEGASPLDLADLFCEQAKLRIDDRFRRLGRNADRKDNAAAKRILKGDFRWLEKGIIEAEPEAYPVQDPKPDK